MREDEMRKHPMAAVAATALIMAALASVALGAGENKPVTVRAGNLEITFDGGFTPTTLSKTELTPISALFEGKLKTVDGSHPPALKEVVIEADKNTGINVKGYPTCTSSKLQSQDSDHARAICGDSILGKGITHVEIQFPEQPPIPVTSPLTLFNGGEQGGVITLFVHAFITVPTPAAIVTTVKVSKISNGRYGLKSVASIPKIAGGSGSVEDFRLNVGKQYTYKGKKVSFITAKCPDGKLQFHGTASFSDGTRASAEVIRTCTGKG
jgi:hypothetical protein